MRKTGRGKGGEELEQEGKGDSQGEGLKIGFWNVAGVRKKDEEFWERIKGWDVIGLVETWVGKEEWKIWKERVPREFRWSVQGAKKKGRKGRARGDIWMGIRKRLEAEEGGTEEEG